MFEIQDERVGRIKIVNVTEARANFAEVLKADLKVVITRHGRPTKILVNYDEYIKLLEEPRSDWNKEKAKAVA